MGLFKNFKRKRQLENLAECHEKIEYYSKSIKHHEKTIAELQKVLEANHAIPVDKADSAPDCETGIYWLNDYAMSYIKEIDNKQNAIALASSKIEYWKTLKKDIQAQSGLHVVINEKPFS